MCSGTGNTVIEAVRVLTEHGLQAKHIILLSLFSTPHGKTTMPLLKMSWIFFGQVGILMSVCVQVPCPLFRNFQTSLYWQPRFMPLRRRTSARGILAQTDSTSYTTLLDFSWNGLCVCVFIIVSVKADQPIESVCACDCFIGAVLCIFIVLLCIHIKCKIIRSHAYPWPPPGKNSFIILEWCKRKKYK